MLDFQPPHVCVAHQAHQNAQNVNVRSSLSPHVVLSGLNLTVVPDTVIKNRKSIKSLILDNNLFTENSFNMPKFDNLKVLSIKYNKIRNIGVLINNLQKSCPNLETLHFQHNPGSTGKNKEQEKILISKCLRKLQYLNDEKTSRSS